MAKQKIPRIMIAGTNSGCGKTTIVCAILAMLKAKGAAAAACKCGPDYIDPMFHRQVFGIPSQNLDLFFCKKEMLSYLMAENAKQADITVVEGVMGYYDGMQMDCVDASSYDVAKQTNTPVILVLQAKGMAYSTVALLKGMLEFQSESQIRGVILNGVSPMAGKKLAEVIERALPIKVYGCIPKLDSITLESRHLGLVTPYELQNLSQKLEQLGQMLEPHLDLEGIQKLANSAPDLLAPVPQELVEYREKKPGNGLRIAVAKDEAFCFYYSENLKLLEQFGCELLPFRPLYDIKLPEKCDVLLLGGGYPELYAEQLSQNQAMLQAVRKHMAEGKFCMAECGGFMYLHETMEDIHHKTFPMAGVISGTTWKTERLVRFGYIDLQPKETSIYANAGRMKGHEFHYWDSSNNGKDFTAVKPYGSRKWSCIHETNQLLAGYPHLYYLSNIEFVAQILEHYNSIRHSDIIVGE